MSLFWLMSYVVFAILLLLSLSNKNTGTVGKSSDDFKGGYFAKKSINTYDVLACFLIFSFSIFCATRDITSYDTSVYETWYYKVTGIDFFNIDGEYGLLFEISTKIIALFTGIHFRYYLFVLAFCNNSFVYILTKRIPCVGAYGYIIYIFLIGFLYNFTVLRQGIAMSFVLWSFLYLDKSKFKMVLGVIIAALYHETAGVVLIVLVFCMFVKIRKKTLYIILGISFINYLFNFSTKIFVFLVDLLYVYIPVTMKGKYVLYFMNGLEERNFSIFYTMYFFITFFLVYQIYKKDNEINEIREIKITNLRINAVGLIVLSLGSSFPVISRVSDYFVLISYVFLLPSAFLSFRKKSRDILVIIFCATCLVLYMKIYLSNAPIRAF